MNEQEFVTILNYGFYVLFCNIIIDNHFLYSFLRLIHFSGGCNPVNWLIKTRKNLIIEYLNLDFVTKVNLVINTIAFTFCGKGLYFFRLAHSRFASAYYGQRIMSKLSRYRYFATYPFGFKVFNQIGNRRYFQQDEKKKCFASENAKEVVEDLGTRSFVTVTKLAPHFCGCGKIPPGKLFLITCRV